MSDLRKKLSNVQQGLKVKKSQYNKFAGFYYRNQEDILEAVKPLLKEEGLVLTVSDEVVNIGEFNYVKAEAWVRTIAAQDEGLFVHGYAREEVIKKGMDTAQITGSTSSYARKYALNGLFNIDDSNDPDNHDNTKPKPVVAKPVTPTAPKQHPLAVAKDELNKMLEQYGHENTVKKKVFISSVLDKSTVETIAEAENVMLALTKGEIDV